MAALSADSVSFRILLFRSLLIARGRTGESAGYDSRRDLYREVMARDYALGCYPCFSSDRLGYDLLPDRQRRYDAQLHREPVFRGLRGGGRADLVRRRPQTARIQSAALL